MALIDHIKRTTVQGRKFNPIYGALLMQGLRTPAWTSANYSALANEGYVQNIDVFACVSLIATTFGGLPWQVMRRKKKADPEPAPDHPLTALIQRPNPTQGMSAFFGAAVAFQELAGNTYIFRFSPRPNQPPRELWTLRPDRTKIIQSGNAAEPILRFEYNSVQLIEFNPDRRGHVISHWKTFHPLDDWYGLSPIQVASRSVDQSNSAAAWNTSLFQNNCRPSGVMKVGGDAVLTKEQYDRMQDLIRREYSGAPNAGMPMLLEGGLEWQSMSLSPLEMDWLEGDERATEKICSVFRVPTELIGRRAKGGLNDSNFIQARKQFYLEKILPEADSFCDEFNNTITPLFDDDSVYLAYDKDEIEAIQEDRTIVHDRALAGVKTTVLTVDEARAKIGEEPLPDGMGEVVLLPNTVIPVGPGADKWDLSAAQPAEDSMTAVPVPGKKPAKKKPADDGTDGAVKELFIELRRQVESIEIKGLIE